MGLMRWAGDTTSAAACRRCAAQSTVAWHRIGNALEHCMGLWGSVTGTEKTRRGNIYYEKKPRDTQARHYCNAQENSV
jgi:hypothetical protein